MTINVPSSATSTQAFFIKTDVELAHSAIVCPIIATIMPSAVNAALISLPGDFGTQLFTMTVNSFNFSGTVAS